MPQSKRRHRQSGPQERRRDEEQHERQEEPQQTAPQEPQAGPVPVQPFTGYDRDSYDPPTPATFWSPLVHVAKIYFCPTKTYPIMKGILLREGHGVATWYVIAGALLNHLRRYATPWLGRHFWAGSKVGHMKLARRAPHYYLEETVSYDALEDVLWVGQLFLYYVLQICAWSVLVHEDPRRRPRPKLLTAILMILHLAIVFTSLEYDFAEYCWSVSGLYAVLAAYGGTKEQQTFMYDLLENNFILAQALMQVLALWYAGQKFWSMMNQAKGWTSGLMVFFAAIGYTTWYIVRYSNYYFMLIEMSDMLLTYFWMTLGIGLVNLDKFRSLRKQQRDNQARAAAS